MSVALGQLCAGARVEVFCNSTGEWQMGYIGSEADTQDVEPSYAAVVFGLGDQTARKVLHESTRLEAGTKAKFRVPRTEEAATDLTKKLNRNKRLEALNLSSRPLKNSEEDLELIATLSANSGTKIRPAGGDYLCHQFHQWWKEATSGQWIFSEDFPVAFARFVSFGSPDSPESGWLEGVRVHADYRGLGLMNVVAEELARRVPARLRAETMMCTSSSYEQVKSILKHKRADKNFLGAYVRFSCDTALAGPAEPSVHTRLLQPTDADAEQAWKFLCVDERRRGCKLVLPARFQTFRACTRFALDEKISAGRAFGTFAVEDNGPHWQRLLGLTFAFDNQCHVKEGDTHVPQFYTCCLDSSLDVKATAILLADLALSLPQVDAEGRPQSNRFCIGPCLSTDWSVDVDPVMAEALAAAKFTRLLPSHVRLYNKAFECLIGNVDS